MLRRLRRPGAEAGQLQVQEGADVGHVHQDVQGEVPQPGIQVGPTPNAVVVSSAYLGGTALDI